MDDAVKRFRKRRAERMKQGPARLDSVEAYRRRRSERLTSRMDDDDEEGGSAGKGHGNTKIPFGLCQKEGIEIQPGWTPQDAWNALEGKGYSAGEVYKRLKETGKVSQKRPARDIRKEYAESKASLFNKHKRTISAKRDYEDSKELYERLKKNPDVAERRLNSAKENLDDEQERYNAAMSAYEQEKKKHDALKKEIDDITESTKKDVPEYEEIVGGVTSFVRSKNVVFALEDAENVIRGQSYESCTCVDKDGKKLFDATDYAESSIDVAPYASRLKDAVFTHNHPKGSTISSEDISCAVRYGMAELRACHGNGAFSLVRQYLLDGDKPENYADFAWDYQEAVKEYDDKIIRPIWEKGPQVQETADKCNKMWEDYRREWLSKNAKKYGWIYSEES